MKIAQVVCTFPPYKGGMGNVAYHYSLELAKLGHQVTVFTPHYKEREVQFQNFKIKSVVPWIRYGNGAWLPQLYWQLRKFDIIHLHYPFFGGALPVYCLKRFCQPKKTKLVLTYHMDVIGEGFLGKFFSWHTKNLMPLTIKAADKVIVTSSDYAQNSNIGWLIKKMPAKFTEIPLGVDVDIFKPQEKEKELLTRYEIESKEKVILFVAALDKAHYFKCLDCLLQSLVRLNKVRLLVIGRGELKPKYEQEAMRLGIRDKVYFVGYISDCDLAKYYNLCDLFVMPSADKSEAFGLVYLEAMACAKPVIATDLAGVRTVVEDGRTGYLIKPRQIDDLTNKIKKILADKKLAQEFGQAGLKKVQARYTWPLVAKKVEGVYKEL